MEVFVLNRLQNSSRHSCRMMMAGKMDSFNFVIMTLLGGELSELRRRLPHRRLSTASTLHVGLQALRALNDLHVVGFVHRDVKPSNFAVGKKDKTHTIFIIDFGLSRQLFVPGIDGKPKLREPRIKVSFRGTVRYCSVNVHEYREQGRHDDLWSWLYMLIELITSTLPWKGLARRDSGALKGSITNSLLCVGCPSSFLEMTSILKQYDYHSMPDDEVFRTKLKRDLITLKVKVSDPFEWEKKEAQKLNKSIKAKEKDVV